MKKSTFLGAALLLISLSMNAQLRMPGVFTDGMVLQRDEPVAVWGTASPNSQVSVQFGKTKVKTRSDESGAWSVSLPAMKACAEPQSLVVVSGKSRKVLNDVLVGEVWIASGQSNMEFNMGPLWRSGSSGKVDRPARGRFQQAEDLIKPEREMMRMMIVEKVTNTDTLPTHGWKHVNAETIAPFSACAYYFAQNLIDSLKVPVGIIESCWGGTRIETWIPEEMFLESDILKGKVADHRYDEEQIGLRFEHMVREIIPYTLRGIIWYQGESNLMMDHADVYPEMQRVLVDSWSRLWGRQLPFYYVQIAPYKYSIRRNDNIVMGWDELPKFREAQEKSLDLIPQSGMAVITDLVDNLLDIHPTYKWEVGRRLADLALKGTYGYDSIVADGPKVVRTWKEGSDVIVEFDRELSTNDGKSPVGFSVSPNGRRYYDAEQVRLEGNRVVVSSVTRVKDPKAVRYAWDEDIITNLCGKEGLPAWQFGPRNL